MKQLIKLNTARNCLKYLIKAYNIEKIFIPYYICPSVKSMLNNLEIAVSYYHIDESFMPTEKFGSKDFILYPNYFGICTNNVKRLEKHYRNLIVDNSQAFYAKPAGMASFSSLRKFFQMSYGIQDGAYLYTEKFLDEEFQTASDYEIDENITYKKIVKNELRLDLEDIMYMSKTTEKIISRINFDLEKDLRITKFKDYENQYGRKNKLSFKLEDDEIPFIYPYYTHDTEIGFELEKSGMLIFRYWKGIPSHFKEYLFYKYLIPIPLS